VKLRAAIIGVGMIGHIHGRAIRSSDATLAAVCDHDARAAEEAAQALGAERSAVSADEVLAADDIDIVHICTPNHLHAPLALAALDARKHVICEKPLATDRETAEHLAATAAAAGVVAAVPFVYRFYPTVRDARERVGRGDAGPLRLLHGSYLQDWLASTEETNWRVDPKLGGPSRAFADIGVHWCDLIEFVTGHRITRLNARLLTAHPKRADGDGSFIVHTEDAATVMFETDHGALGSLVISQVSQGRKNRLWFSVDGDAASLAFDQEVPDVLWIGGPDQNSLVLRGSSGTGPGAARYNVLPAGHPQGYQDCFDAFVRDTYRAVRDEEPDGLPTFADGHRAATLTAAVLESAACTSWVEVSPHRAVASAMGGSPMSSGGSRL
jgi:predicted dehydrogenase